MANFYVDIGAATGAGAADGSTPNDYMGQAQLLGVSNHFGSNNTIKIRGKYSGGGSPSLFSESGSNLVFDAWDIVLYGPWRYRTSSNLSFTISATSSLRNAIIALPQNDSGTLPNMQNVFLALGSGTSGYRYVKGNHSKLTVSRDTLSSSTGTFLALNAAATFTDTYFGADCTQSGFQVDIYNAGGVPSLGLTNCTSRKNNLQGGNASYVYNDVTPVISPASCAVGFNQTATIPQWDDLVLTHFDLCPGFGVGAPGGWAVVSTIAPSINTQPNSISVTSGQTATFTLTASGTPDVSYEWQQLLGATWTALSNGGNVSGATTATLSISNVILGNSGSQYRCRVYNGTLPDAVSNSVVLNVINIGGQNTHDLNTMWQHRDTKLGNSNGDKTDNSTGDIKKTSTTDIQKMGKQGSNVGPRFKGRMYGNS